MINLLNELISPRLAAALAIGVLVKASAILGLAWLSTFLLRRAGAATRYGVWGLAFSALLLLPAFSLTLPAWTVPLPAVATPVAAPVAAASAGSLLPNRAEAPVAMLDRANSPASPISFTVHRAAPLSPFAVAAVLLWVLGALVFLLRLGVGTLAMTCLSRGALPPKPAVRALSDRLRAELGIRRPIRVRHCDDAEVPVTWGLWRPLVLLPAEARGWSEARLRAVLLHELAHIHRWDYATHLLQHLVCALYWMNPLVWLAVRRAQLEQERACDDVVLGAGVQSREYAGHLVEIARAYAGGTFRPSLAMAQPSTLETRVRGILSQHCDRGALTPRALFLAGLTAAAVALPLASFKLLGEGREQRESRLATAGLASPDPVVRERAAWALGQLHWRPAIPALIQRLKDPAPEVRGVAAWALGFIKQRSAIPAVIATLQDEDAYVREMAVLALGAMGDPEAVEALIPLTRDPASGVRSVSTRALGQLGTERAGEALGAMLASDSDEHTRQMAAGTLGKLHLRASLPALIGALQDHSGPVRSVAVYSLGQLADPGAIPALGWALARDPESRVRAQAADALGQIPDDRAASELLPGLADSSRSVRVSTAYALGRVGGPTAVDGLLTALRDPEHTVRLTAVEALDSLRSGPTR